MLFVTNRMPRQSARSKRNRAITFDPQNTTPSHSLFFCERTGAGQYTEIMSQAFFARLKQDKEYQQILLFIHGFNNNMEPDVFGSAATLQQLLDKAYPGLARVIPLVWPCDDDSTAAIVDDYWDDQRTADMSGDVFARFIGKFDNWRSSDEQLADPCLKRINVLAHSMGNRVLKNATRVWAEHYCGGEMPQLFRNVFMIAPDVRNNILSDGEEGQYIVDSGRNLVVYYANDDLAMPASKLANVKNRIFSRRMGMTGPEHLDDLRHSVYAVDCDEFNGDFDKKGHTYFLLDDKGRVSPIIDHLGHTINSRRVPHDERRHILRR